MTKAEVLNGNSVWTESKVKMQSKPWLKTLGFLVCLWISHSKAEEGNMYYVLETMQRGIQQYEYRSIYGSSLNW